MEHWELSFDDIEEHLTSNSNRALHFSPIFRNSPIFRGKTVWCLSYNYLSLR
jgi:hypothetical protein